MAANASLLSPAQGPAGQKSRSLQQVTHKAAAFCFIHLLIHWALLAQHWSFGKSALQTSPSLIMPRTADITFHLACASQMQSAIDPKHPKISAANQLDLQTRMPPCDSRASRKMPCSNPSVLGEIDEWNDRNKMKQIYVMTHDLNDKQ